jgi:hypothetical protein
MTTLRSTIFLVLVCCLGVLAGCGSVNPDGATSDGYYNHSNFVSGFAYNTAPISNGTVTVRDIDGLTRYATTDENGYYGINGDAMVSPFMIKIDWIENGSYKTLYSFADVPGTVNINPFTSAAVILAAGSYAPLDTFNSSTQYAYRIAFADTVTSLRSKLASILALYGSENINPVTGSYARGTTLERFFFMVAMDFAGTSMEIRNSFDSSLIASTPITDLQALTIPMEKVLANSQNVAITGLSATSGDVATHLTISGTGFDRRPADTYVSIAGVRAITRSISATSIEVLIPLACKSGIVAVVVPAADGSVEYAFSSSRFTVGKQYDSMILGVQVDQGKLILDGLEFGDVNYVTITQGGTTINLTAIIINPPPPPPPADSTDPPAKDPDLFIREEAQTVNIGVTAATRITFDIPAGLDTTREFTVTAKRKVKTLVGEYNRLEEVATSNTFTVAGTP